MSKRGNANCEPLVVASRLRDHLLSSRTTLFYGKRLRSRSASQASKDESKVLWEWARYKSCVISFLMQTAS
ncbi:hypothetical protein BDE02_03G077500 [Populus trichocarpa]|nr:hypothetical protein BDE02_03G077500 [Populus trichocarpa]